jgi:transposase InsO family protein
MGPFTHSSIRKVRYFLTFIDDYSCYTWVYFLSQNSEFFEHIKDFKALVETQTGKKIKILHTNNGGKYINKDVHNLFHEAGIELQHTFPYTLQENEVVERKNRSLKEITSFMLHARSLPSKIWACYRNIFLAIAIFHRGPFSISLCRLVIPFYESRAKNTYFPHIRAYILYNMRICRLLHYNPPTSGFVPKNTKMESGFHVMIRDL